MSSVSLFGFLAKNIIKNHLKYVRQQSTFKIVVVSWFSLFFWGSIFALFYYGFAFLWRYIPGEFFGLIMNYLFALFYFSLFVMLIFSSTIIALSVFFHARETHYLMTCPVSLVDIFFYKLTETFLFASWAVFFLGLPVCFAYGLHQKVSLSYYPLLTLAFIPYIVIPSLIGSVVALFVVLYLVRWRRLIGMLFLVFLAGVVVWLGYSITTFKEKVTPFTGTWLLGILDYLDFARHPLSPTTWMSKAMIASAQDQYGEFMLQMFFLTITALFLVNITYVLADLGYGLAWSQVHSETAAKSFWRFPWLARSIRCLVFLSRQDRLFLEKDIKIFLRDPLQWGQFAILLGLLLLYTLNLRTLRYDQQSIFWKHIIATLNLTATGLTICTFASRFIFPMLSLEGKRFWTIGIMPISRTRVLMAKFCFALVTLLLTGGILIFLSCYMLRLPWQLTCLHIVSMFGMTIGVAGLSVGLGAIYPNFHQDSPARIVSGFGGTLNLVLGMVFVMLFVAIQIIPSHVVLQVTGQYQFYYLSMLSAVLLTLAACVIPMYFGSYYFNRAEF